MGSDRMGSRRWAGLLVMVAVLLGAVAANVGSKSLPGSAVAAPMPPLPLAGECMTSPINSGETDVTIGDSSYPTGTFAPCAGGRYGEVISVIDAPAVTSSTGTSESTGIDTYEDKCSVQANSFLGLDNGGHLVDPSVAIWTPGIYNTVANLIAPNPIHADPRQKWLACIVQPGISGSSARYEGSLQNVYRTFDVPPALAQCTNPETLAPNSQGELTIDTLDCTSPHRAELFGLLGVPLPNSKSALEASCRQLVAALTKMPDPTAGGLLTVEVLGDLQGTSTPTTCVVVSSTARQLVGSLLSLGSRPVPWAK